MRSTFSAAFSALLFLGTTVSAQSGLEHVLIEGTTSPDGRYAVAWGIPYETVDLQNPGDIDLNRVENFLINLETGSRIATLGTSYFATAEFEKNHASFTASWREDSRAVFFLEGTKWGFETAAVVYITHPENAYDPCSDVIPVSQAIRRAVRRRIEAQHPEVGDRLPDFVVSAHPELPVWSETLTLMTSAVIPKSEDSIFFEEKLSVTLPGPDLLTPAEQGGNEGTGNSEFLITASSAGPVALGMTINEARDAMPGATFERSSDGEGIAYVAVVENGETLMELHTGEYDPDTPINGDAKIEFLQVWSPRFQTADGIGAGTPVSVADAAFGGVAEIIMSEIESREYATFREQPSGLHFRLTNENNTAGDYQGDNITNRYLPGASIFVIEVTGPHIMQDGSIGGIRLNAPESEVYKLAAENGFGPFQKGQDIIWEAFGQAVQTWNFPQAGISFDMISDEIGGEKSVFSITMTAPCGLRTGTGIGIGAAKEEVIRAYRAYEATNEEHDDYFGDADVHLVGSIYGGMIFTFENGQLRDVFLGAAAE